MLSYQLKAALDEMSAREVRKALRRRGCKELRQKGSHLQVQCGPRRSTVPVHSKKDIAPGTLRSIERSLGIDL
jgi:predicted RNA binding protein YcfA (HicA-like mRNA interferase family)